MAAEQFLRSAGVSKTFSLFREAGAVDHHWPATLVLACFDLIPQLTEEKDGSS